LAAWFCWTQFSIRKNIPALGALALATAVMLAIRLAIFGGMGGYPEPGGAPHFMLKLTTFTSLFNRAITAPLYLLKSSVPLPAWASVGVIAMAVWGAVQSLVSRGPLRRQLVLIAAGLASALPALNLVSWIGPEVDNVRYVYQVAMWIFLLTASAAWS